MTIHPIRQNPGNEQPDMTDVQGKILEIYDKSKPEEEHLFDSSNWNHLAWCLALAFAALSFWLAIALVNAENQRNALITNQCMDPVFKGEVDRKCLQHVHSRPHWWGHLWYGFTHVSPEAPATGRR
jgi:hypothetical protein